MPNGFDTRYDQKRLVGRDSFLKPVEYVQDESGFPTTKPLPKEEVESRNLV